MKTLKLKFTVTPEVRFSVTVVLPPSVASKLESQVWHADSNKGKYGLKNLRRKK